MFPESLSPCSVPPAEWQLTLAPPSPPHVLLLCCWQFSMAFVPYRPFPCQCCLSPAAKSKGKEQSHVSPAQRLLAHELSQTELVSSHQKLPIPSSPQKFPPPSSHQKLLPPSPCLFSTSRAQTSATTFTAGSWAQLSPSTPPARLAMPSPQQDWSSRAPQSRMECTSFFSACALSKASVKGR